CTALGVPDPHCPIKTRRDDPRAIWAERRPKKGVAMPLECEELGMAEAMDVLPLPAAQFGTGAVEQGQRGGDVVLPPLLVGHLDGPPVVEPLELLPLPF